MLPTANSINGECVCPYCNGRFKVVESKEIQSYACKRCGFEWDSPDTPLKCPKCDSYSWDKDYINCCCQVCHYSWESHANRGTDRCPNCKSNRWNEKPAVVSKKICAQDSAIMKGKWIMDRYELGYGCLDIASELGIPLFTVMRIVTTELNLSYAPRMKSNQTSSRAAEPAAIIAK